MVFICDSWHLTFFGLPWIFLGLSKLSNTFHVSSILCCHHHRFVGHRPWLPFWICWSIIYLPSLSQLQLPSDFFLIFIVIQLHLYALSPHPSTPTHLNPPPSPTSTLPLDFVHMSFIVVPVIPSPHCPHPTPPWLLLDCSQLQCLWLYFVCFFLRLIMFQLNSMQQRERRSFYPLQQHGWNWRALC